MFGGQFPTFRKQPDDFGHEKGIAFSVGIKRAGQLLGKLDAGSGFDELSKLILAQAAEQLAAKDRFSRQPGQRVRQGMLP